MKTNRSYRITSIIQNYIKLDRDDTIKLVFSTAAFFFIIGAYSILRSLKTSIFLSFVGREYEPLAKLVAILFAVPAMIIHAKVSDSFKKHQIVYFFIGFYVVILCLFSLLLCHPTIGIANTHTSPYRIVGWAFELLMDLMQALIVGTFWSFINSVSTPVFAEKGYGFIVAGSRIGGILATLISWLILEKTTLSSATSIPLLTAGATSLLALSIYSIYLIKKNVSSDHLHGYEAAYKIEQDDDRKHKHSTVFEGLKIMLTEPYVFGIFALVFSYEVVNIMFDYQMHVLMSIETNNQIGAMSSFMLLYTGAFQFMSLFFALFGTSAILSRLGVRWGLLVMPACTFFLAIVPMLYPKLFAIFIVMVLLRALNYGFNHPLREMLFIPTVKDIRFKSKAWIESFGRTFSKTTGSTLNMVAILQSPYVCIVMESFISMGLTVLWALVAIGIGKKYIKTIMFNDVIGKDRLDKKNQ